MNALRTCPKDGGELRASSELALNSLHPNSLKNHNQTNQHQTDLSRASGLLLWTSPLGALGVPLGYVPSTWGRRCGLLLLCLVGVGRRQLPQDHHEPLHAGGCLPARCSTPAIAPAPSPAAALQLVAPGDENPSLMLAPVVGPEQLAAGRLAPLVMELADSR